VKKASVLFLEETSSFLNVGTSCSESSESSLCDASSTATSARPLFCQVCAYEDINGVKPKRLSHVPNSSVAPSPRRKKRPSPMGKYETIISADHTLGGDQAGCNFSVHSNNSRVSVHKTKILYYEHLLAKCESTSSFEFISVQLKFWKLLLSSFYLLDHIIDKKNSLSYEGIKEKGKEDKSDVTLCWFYYNTSLLQYHQSIFRDLLKDLEDQMNDILKHTSQGSDSAFPFSATVCSSNISSLSPSVSSSAVLIKLSQLVENMRSLHWKIFLEFQLKMKAKNRKELISELKLMNFIESSVGGRRLKPIVKIASFGHSPFLPHLPLSEHSFLADEDEALESLEESDVPSWCPQISSDVENSRILTENFQEFQSLLSNSCQTIMKLNSPSSQRTCFPISDLLDLSCTLSTFITEWDSSKASSCMLSDGFVKGLSFDHVENSLNGIFSNFYEIWAVNGGNIQLLNEDSHDKTVLVDEQGKNVVFLNYLTTNVRCCLVYLDLWFNCQRSQRAENKQNNSEKHNVGEVYPCYRILEILIQIAEKIFPKNAFDIYHDVILNNEEIILAIDGFLCSFHEIIGKFVEWQRYLEEDGHNERTSHLSDGPCLSYSSGWKQKQKDIKELQLKMEFSFSLYRKLIFVFQQIFQFLEDRVKKQRRIRSGSSNSSASLLSYLLPLFRSSCEMIFKSVFDYPILPISLSSLSSDNSLISSSAINEINQKKDLLFLDIFEFIWKELSFERNVSLLLTMIAKPSNHMLDENEDNNLEEKKEKSSENGETKECDDNNEEKDEDEEDDDRDNEEDEDSDDDDDDGDDDDFARKEKELETNENENEKADYCKFHYELFIELFYFIIYFIKRHNLEMKCEQMISSFSSSSSSSSSSTSVSRRSSTRSSYSNKEEKKGSCSYYHEEDRKEGNTESMLKEQQSSLVLNSNYFLWISIIQRLLSSYHSMFPFFLVSLLCSSQTRLLEEGYEKINEQPKGKNQVSVYGMNMTILIELFSNNYFVFLLRTILNSSDDFSLLSSSLLTPYPPVSIISSLFSFFFASEGGSSLREMINLGTYHDLIVLLMVKCYSSCLFSLSSTDYFIPFSSNEGTTPDEIIIVRYHPSSSSASSSSLSHDSSVTAGRYVFPFNSLLFAFKRMLSCLHIIHSFWLFYFEYYLLRKNISKKKLTEEMVEKGERSESHNSKFLLLNEFYHRLLQDKEYLLSISIENDSSFYLKSYYSNSVDLLNQIILLFERYYYDGIIDIRENHQMNENGNDFSVKRRHQQRNINDHQNILNLHLFSENNWNVFHEMIRNQEEEQYDGSKGQERDEDQEEEESESQYHSSQPFSHYYNVEEAYSQEIGSDEEEEDQYEDAHDEEDEDDSYYEEGEELEESGEEEQGYNQPLTNRQLLRLMRYQRYLNGQQYQDNSNEEDEYEEDEEDEEEEEEEEDFEEEDSSHERNDEIRNADNAMIQRLDVVNDHDFYFFRSSGSNGVPSSDYHVQSDRYPPNGFGRWQQMVDEEEIENDELEDEEVTETAEETSHEVLLDDQVENNVTGEVDTGLIVEIDLSGHTADEDSESAL
jgi:hypothetical protein